MFAISEYIINTQQGVDDSECLKMHSYALLLIHGTILSHYSIMSDELIKKTKEMHLHLVIEVFRDGNSLSRFLIDKIQGIFLAFCFVNPQQTYLMYMNSLGD